MYSLYSRTAVVFNNYAGILFIVIMCNRYHLLLNKHLTANGAMFSFGKSCFRARCGFRRIYNLLMVTGKRISARQECMTQQIYSVI